MLEEFKNHFDAGYCNSIQHYVKEVATRNMRYIFMTGKRNHKEGFCTHCKESFGMPNIKHKDFFECPNCRKEYEVRNTGYSRKYFVDRVYFTYFEKSLINPSILVARGIMIELDFRFSYTHVEPKYYTKAYYLFEYGKGATAYYNTWAEYGQSWTSRNWTKCKTISEVAKRSYYLSEVNIGISLESLRDAEVDSTLKYCGWESFCGKRGDSYLLIDYLALASKYPCVEYLTKCGHDHLVESKLTGRPMYHLINWRAKTLDKVLKLSKHQLKVISRANINISIYYLKLIQYLEESDKRFDVIDAHKLLTLFDTYYGDFDTSLKFMSSNFLPYMDLWQFYKYLFKQYSHDGRCGLICYRDYLEECKQLNMDLSQESVLFPSKLYEAHEKTMKLIKTKEDAEIKAAIDKRVEELPSWRDGIYLIRPAASVQELVDEGQALSHCVGRYSKGYANGSSDLYFVRKVEEEDKPFVTVEIREGEVVQARGYKNGAPGEDVTEFINNFVKMLGVEVTKAVEMLTLAA